MTAGDRPLPTPPRSRFGGGRDEGEGTAPLTADRMAQAAAAGRLEEFLQHEIPAGDHARNLALMMMGMSGMMPANVPAGQPPDAAAGQPAAETGGEAPVPAPPEVLRAAGEGDVAGLMGLLRAEHAKRNPGCDPDPGAPRSPEPAPGAAPAASSGPRAGIDAALVDELLRIAVDNDVTVDWLMLRAVKLYIEDFRRTGRL